MPFLRPPGGFLPRFDLAREKVLAVVEDDATASALKSGLAALGDDLELLRGNIRTAIRTFEEQATASSLIVDLACVSDAQAALDDLSLVCPPNVRLFVIGENADLHVYRLLIRELGVIEYLPKPLTHDAVLRLLLPHLAAGTAGPPSSRGGAIVAVCGARGGVGASSIALNLAYEIMNTVEGHVALLDLHVQGGEMAVMLSVRPGPSLRMALEDAGRIDSLFLERASIEIEPRLRLIASEETFGASTAITETGLLRVLGVLQKKFNFIVADIPMPMPPQMLRILTLARQIIAVATPDAASMRDTQNIRQLVTAVTGADRTISVLNRANMKGGLKPRLVETALGGQPDVSIPDLGHGMLEAINLGVPAIQKVPSLRRHLAPLVREITGAGPSRTTGSWLTRLFGR